MSIINKPFKLGIKTPELTKRRVKAATVRILKDVHDQFRRFIKAWAKVRCPEDTGELRRDLVQSAMQAFVQDSELWVGIVLFLDSRKPYSEFVNEMVPPVNWTKVTSAYNFFTEVIQEINDMLPRWIRYAIEREEGA